MGNEKQKQQCPFWIPAETIYHRQDLCTAFHCRVKLSKLGPLDSVFASYLSPALADWRTSENSQLCHAATEITQFWSPLKISGMDVVISENKVDCGQQPLGISAGLGKFNTRHAGQRTKILSYYMSGINTRLFNSINSMPSCSCHTCKCY